MHEAKEKFTSYFINKGKELPKIRENELQGWFEEIRLEVFQENNFDCHLLTDKPFNLVQGNVYQIWANTLSAVLVYYESSNEIFWLDDHNSNADFEYFFFKERLHALLPTKVNHVAQIFVKTKYNYLGMPKLIQDVSEITENKDNFFEFRNRKFNSTEELQKLQNIIKRLHNRKFNSTEELQKLQNIIKRLHNPNVSLKNGIFQLEFCLWTTILGRIIKIQSAIDSEGHIKCSAEQLTQEIGNWYVPK